MPLISGCWTSLPESDFTATLPPGVTWPNGTNWLHFTKSASRTRITTLAGQFGWPLIGIFVSGSGGPDGLPDYVLNRSEIPLVNTPSGPIISIQGNTGNRTYSYVVQGLSGEGKEVSPASTAATITNGNVNLGANNFNRVSWAAIPNAASYKLYRTANTGNNPATGKIGLIAATTTLTIDDKALVGDGSSPSAPTLMNCVQNILDAAITQLYVEVVEGSRSFWINTHFWVYRSDGLYIPRVSGVGEYSFQVSNDSPPANWWKDL